MNEKREKNLPILGICLGMQVLSNLGTENEQSTNGLDFIPGTVENISKINALNKCHVGWNNIKFKENLKYLKVSMKILIFILTIVIILK